MEENEHLYKILVIGDIGTGKTSIIQRYVHNTFSANYKSTIGVDFALKVLNIQDGDVNNKIRLQLWDIAGQERFGNMTRIYYKQAVAAFIVFDVSRVATYEAIIRWKNDIDEKLDSPYLPIILLANKGDLNQNYCAKNKKNLDALCEKHTFKGWFETSAKNNTGIDKAVDFLVKQITKENENDNEVIRIPNKTKEINSEKQKEGGGCCN